MIEDTFKKPNFLKLQNSYEVKGKVVTAVLVTLTQDAGENKETIWIATAGKDGPYNLMTYIFVDQDTSLSHRAIKLKQLAHPKLCVSVSQARS